MKLSEAKHYLPFVQAAAEGKVIQYTNNQLTKWKDADDNLHLDWFAAHDLSNGWKYRIKPTPKLRPWKPEEVPVGALIKYDGTVAVISFATNQRFGFVKVYDGTDDLDVRQWNYEIVYDTILHSLDHGKTWLPCGVMTEE